MRTLELIGINLGSFDGLSYPIHPKSKFVQWMGFVQGNVFEVSIT